MHQLKSLNNADLPDHRTYLVIGGDGLIGSALSRELLTITPNVYKTSRRRGVKCSHTISYDLTQSPIHFFRNELIQKIISQGRMTVFFSAAITKIAECEKDSTQSRLVNVINTLEICKKLMLSGSDVVFISSNAVFDGLTPFPSELSVRNANTNYGLQKIETEQALIDINEAIPNAPRLMIARLTKVVSKNNPLIKDWIRNLSSGGQVDAFENRILSPISLEFTINNLVSIASRGQTGIYHISGSQDLSYYRFACLMASSLNVDLSLINPVLATTSIASLENQYSALGETAANILLNISPQAPEEALKSLML
jgi:dTDP-4-dehydrorhamnose reductase